MKHLADFLESLFLIIVEANAIFWMVFSTIMLVSWIIE